MLKCDLCGSSKDVSHLSISIGYQEAELDGKHLHICPSCKEEFYGKILETAVEDADKRIIAVYKRGSLRKQIVADDKYAHNIFRMSLYLPDLTDDEMDELELKMDAAGLDLWRESGEEVGNFFADYNKYMYLIFDDPEWTISMESISNDQNGVLIVDLNRFNSELEKYANEKGIA